MARKPSVAVLGGGTGTFMMLLALKQLPVDITAILTMVDDGGSNRVLRDQFGLLPTSGVSQCIVALSENQTLLRELFNYRYKYGEGIKGMRFGNLFIAAVTDIVGSQKEAIEETQRLLQVNGTILPISYDNVRLVATYEDGSEIIGEHYIDEPPTQHDGKMRITDLRTDPPASISADAKQAIADADYVIFGPGDFYTNTVANFIVEGVDEALKASKAEKIFFTNLMTKYGETYEYTIATFLEEVDRYYGLDGLDTVIVNSNQDYPEEAIEAYAKQQARPIVDDIEGDTYRGVKVLRGDLVADHIFGKSDADVLQRSILRHDPDKVAKFLAKKVIT